MALKKPEIVVSYDHVIICGQVVLRPASLSPSQWYRYWEKVAKLGMEREYA